MPSFHAANIDKLIILDEVQRLPEVFSELRGIIDKERRAGKKNGQFLFLGSASIDLLKQSGESLSGRISYMELHPIDALEFAAGSIDKMNTLWARGGFPDSLLGFDDKISLAWRRSFIRTYLERDIPQLGPRIPAETLERFWTMLAVNKRLVRSPKVYVRNSSPSVSKGFYIACDDIEPTRRYVVYSGEERFSLGHEVMAIPLTELMLEISKQT